MEGNSVAETALQDLQLLNPDAEDVYDDGYLRVEHQNYYLACGGAIDLPAAY